MLFLLPLSNCGNGNKVDEKLKVEGRHRQAGWQKVEPLCPLF